MTLPSRPLKRHTRACRGWGRLPRSACAIIGTCGPETRITATPAGPAALASAAMVSPWEPEASRMAASVPLVTLVTQPFRIQLAIDIPLLGDGQQTVGTPVQYQPGREECEKYGHADRHDLHDALLHRIHDRGHVQLLLQKHDDAEGDRQNVIGVRGRQILDPENEWRLAKLRRFTQHPVQRDKYRHLYQQRPTTGHRV